ncbi:MAG: hypothetical protein RR382_05380 [Tannerellaceae bacterium]
MLAIKLDKELLNPSQIAIAKESAKYGLMTYACIKTFGMKELQCDGSDCYNCWNKEAD